MVKRSKSNFIRAEPVALAVGAHRAVGDQLLQVGAERARRDAVNPRRHVVVDERQQLVEARLAELRERVAHLALALQAVLHQAPHLLVRLADEIAVPGSDDREVFAEQQLERGEVGAHVAVGRIDDDGRALHHVVAGEEHARLFQQVAEVVRGMARRMDGAQRDARERDALAVCKHVVGLEGRVLARGRGPAEDLSRRSPS